MSTIRPRVFKIYLEDSEQDIISNISILDSSDSTYPNIGEYYLLEDMSANDLRDTYASYLDSDYLELTHNESYNVSIMVFDRAMNSDYITQEIIIDDEDPIINITEFKSGGVTINIGGDPLNITTRNTTININGTVTDLLIDQVCLVSYSPVVQGSQTICKELCGPGEDPPDCIADTGAFEFEFIMILNPATHTIGTEVWNFITINAQQ